eukprot:3368588-Pleurochrysis_carterae.AAC.1
MDECTCLHPSSARPDGPKVDVAFDRRVSRCAQCVLDRARHRRCAPRPAHVSLDRRARRRHQRRRHALRCLQRLASSPQRSDVARSVRSGIHNDVSCSACRARRRAVAAGCVAVFGGGVGHERVRNRRRFVLGATAEMVGAVALSRAASAAARLVVVRLAGHARRLD